MGPIPIRPFSLISNRSGESDALGVQIMSDAGYDPRTMINVMTILAKASGGRQLTLGRRITLLRRATVPPGADR